MAAVYTVHSCKNKYLRSQSALCQQFELFLVSKPYPVSMHYLKKETLYTFSWMAQLNIYNYLLSFSPHSGWALDVVALLDSSLEY